MRYCLSTVVALFIYHFVVVMPTGSLTLREEHRLRVFENRALRRDEVMGGWRKLHNEELHDLYSSPSIIRIIKSRSMRWGRRGMHIDYWWESQRERATRKTKT
jgi:hypothetical protein